MSIILDTPDQIAAYQLLALRGRLSLEVKGLRFKEGSTSAYLKRTYGYKGSKAKVLELFENDLRAAGVLSDAH